jgi:hypothetical protein
MSKFKNEILVDVIKEVGYHDVHQVGEQIVVKLKHLKNMIDQGYVTVASSSKVLTFDELIERDIQMAMAEILEQTGRFVDVDFHNEVVGSYDEDPISESMFMKYDLLLITDNVYAFNFVDELRKSGRIVFQESGYLEFNYSKSDYPEVFEYENCDVEDYPSNIFVQLYVYKTLEGDMKYNSNATA